MSTNNFGRQTSKSGVSKKLFQVYMKMQQGLIMPAQPQKTASSILISPRAKGKSSLREKIMDAATIRFAEFGYAGCSMRDLAVDLNITATSIYYNFKDKETLYLEVCRRRFDLAAKQIEHAFVEGLPPEDQILGFLERLVALLEQDSIYFRIVQLQLLERNVEEVRLLSTMAFIPQYKVLQTLIRKISPAANYAQCAFNLYALALGYAQFKSLRKAFPKEINIGQTPKEISRLIFDSVLPAVRRGSTKKPAKI